MNIVFMLLVVHLKSMIDSVNDLEELLSNSNLSLRSTTFKTSKIVGYLDSVITEGSLEPLNEVTKSFLRKIQAHREI